MGSLFILPWVFWFLEGEAPKLVMGVKIHKIFRSLGFSRGVPKIAVSVGERVLILLGEGAENP